MSYFPVFIDLSDKEILVVGAGVIAARRVRTLLDFAGHMTVVAPAFSEEISEMAQAYPQQITLLQDVFQEEQLDGRDMVLTATDDRELNRRIAALCRERSLFVNSSSEKECCDFYFPSIVQKDDVVIGINASGKNHSLVKQTRIELEEFFKR